jgi:hypothetical protein
MTTIDSSISARVLVCTHFDLYPQFLLQWKYHHKPGTFVFLSASKRTSGLFISILLIIPSQCRAFQKHTSHLESGIDMAKGMR